MLKIELSGPGGSGKSHWAMKIAASMAAEGKKCFVGDEGDPGAPAGKEFDVVILCKLEK